MWKVVGGAWVWQDCAKGTRSRRRRLRMNLECLDDRNGDLE